MDSGEEIVIDLLLMVVAAVALLAIVASFFPKLLDSINNAISGASSSAAGAAVAAASSAAKGAAYGVAAAAGASPTDVNNTFAGNPTSPGYDFIYGPNKFSLSSFWQALTGWWQETTNPALDSGASGPSAGGFPIGTDVSNYSPGNWSDYIYAPPPPGFGLDQPTQNLLDYLGANG